MIKAWVEAGVPELELDEKEGRTTATRAATSLPRARACGWTCSRTSRRIEDCCNTRRHDSSPPNAARPFDEYPFPQGSRCRPLRVEVSGH
jgi:hypothetical protein